MSLPDKTHANLTVDGDMLGTWLETVLTGKRTMHIYDSKGEEVTGKETSAPGTYSTSVTTNSMQEPMALGGGCCYEISFHWDQWFECDIRCTHGTFKGTSDFFNMTESLMRAVTTFNKVDHPDEVPDAVADKETAGENHPDMGEV
jgi:hypothetical protein